MEREGVDGADRAGAMARRQCRPDGAAHADNLAGLSVLNAGLDNLPARVRLRELERPGARLRARATPADLRRPRRGAGTGCARQCAADVDRAIPQCDVLRSEAAERAR